MIRALVNSFKLATSRPCRRILLLALFLALLVFLLLGWLAGLAFGALPQFDTEWLNLVTGWLARVGFFVGAWLMFPWVVSLFVGFFLDDVALAAEKRFYPDDEAGRAMPMPAAIWAALRYGSVVIVANIAALPVYAFVWWIPGAVPVVYLGLNAYLLSREYFELVAHRHVGWDEARGLRKQHQGRIMLGGLIIALLFSLPLINLITPVVATILMVQVFKATEAREKATRQRPEYRSMCDRIEDNEIS